MKKAVYPGSFDPFTNGHLDIISRASKFVDELHIVVADNVNKAPLFTTEERTEMIKTVTKDLPNVVIASSNKLVVEYARDNEIFFIIRGLRNLLDYVGEYQLYNFNRNLNSEIETIIMFPSIGTHYVSSSAIKELVAHDADITPYVPVELVDTIVRKYRKVIK